MPKVKIPRKNISLDMTAMCDMAFLLLTFFMLATKFKDQEAVVVDIPSSHSKVILQDLDLMTISVRNDGAVFFGLNGQHARLVLLQRMSDKYKIPFSEEEKKKFSLTESFGVPINMLKSFLNTEDEEAKKIMQKAGIPKDSIDNQLKEWVYNSRFTSDSIEVAIKGDRRSNYEVVEKIIATLQEQNINKINLITSLENQ